MSWADLYLGQGEDSSVHQWCHFIGLRMWIVQRRFEFPRTCNWTILGMGSTNERRRYSVTSSLIDWAHIVNDRCIYKWDKQFFVACPSHILGWSISRIGPTVRTSCLHRSLALCSLRDHTLARHVRLVASVVADDSLYISQSITLITIVERNTRMYNANPNVQISNINAKWSLSYKRIK